jgi:hypothetical protein
VSTGGRFRVGAQVTEQCVILAVTFEQDVTRAVLGFPFRCIKPNRRCPSVIRQQPTKLEQ